MESLSQLINEIESHCSSYDRTYTAVSQVSVGWHLQHSLNSVVTIADTLAASNPEAYRWTLNLPWLYVSLLGKIPRGRGKAPDISLPTEEIRLQSLSAALIAAKAKIVEMEELDPKQFIVHPVFGSLKKKRAIRFLEIHTRHHLAIVNEILNAAN